MTTPTHKKDIWKPPVKFAGYNTDHFIIYDTEYTTWEGALERSWSGENEYIEIVQIGAIKVCRETFEVIDTLDIYIKPRINPELSDFFTQLTGITNDKIAKEGVDFVEGTEKFMQFSHEMVAYSYGNDMCVMATNAGLYKLKTLGIKKARPHFASIVPFFRKADTQTCHVNSEHLAEHFGLNMDDNHMEHNALEDCYSILKAMKYLVEEKGMQLPF